MEEITKNSYYELAYDPSKNRIYIKVIGYWRDASVVPDYVRHWEEVLALARPNFTVLADLTEMKPHPPGLAQLHKKTMQMSKVAGHLESAQLFSDEMAEWQLEEIGRNSSVQSNKFNNREEAEAFLDTFLEKSNLSSAEPSEV